VVGVVGRVGDELVVDGQPGGVEQRLRVIGFEDALGPIVERPVADQRAKPAGGDEVAVIGREGVDGAADADGVVLATPRRALDRAPARLRSMSVKAMISLWPSFQLHRPNMSMSSVIDCSVSWVG
jgi:hypothetical protein